MGRCPKCTGANLHDLRGLVDGQVQHVSQDYSLSLLEREVLQHFTDPKLVLNMHWGLLLGFGPMPLTRSMLSPLTPPRRGGQIDRNPVGPSLRRSQRRHMRPPATSTHQGFLNQLLRDVYIAAMVRHRCDEPGPGASAEALLLAVAVVHLTTFLPPKPLALHTRTPAHPRYAPTGDCAVRRVNGWSPRVPWRGAGPCVSLSGAGCCLTTTLAHNLIRWTQLIGASQASPSDSVIVGP